MKKLVPLVLLSCFGCQSRTMNSDVTSVNVGNVSVGATFKSGISEVSGLAFWNTGLLVVGDRSFEVANLNPATDESKLFNLQKALGAKDGAESAWEAIAVDGNNTAFLLVENTASIEVIDLKKQQKLIDIDLVVDTKRVPFDWKKENSGGEGMVLMRNGHILVVKEKGPPTFLEFGPADHQPSGVSDKFLLGANEKFAITGGKLVLLKVWKLSKKSREVLADISEISAGPGGLYALSEESRRVALMETSFALDEDEVKIKAAWDVPMPIEHPEGMAFDKNGGLFLGTDRGNADKKNVFFMKLN